MSANTKIFDVHEEVKRELEAIPGVRSVGIGLKEVAGELTNQIAFKVYVDEKKPLSTLDPANVIPDEIRGFKTDVIRIAEKTLLTGAGPRPLVGGIAVSSLLPSGIQEHGTLGCIAKLNNSTNKVLLSNEHVFRHLVAIAGSPNTVFQPSHSDSLGFVCNEVGRTAKGTDANVSFNNGTFTAEFYVDCAIATLDGDIGARNQIFGMGPINGSADISNLVINDPAAFRVKKRGTTTRLTIGTVEDIAFDDPVGSTPRARRQIIIRPAPGHRYDKTFRVKAADKAAIIAKFAGHPVVITDVGGDKLRFQTNAFALPGDSGAMLLNDSNAVVGLVFASLTIGITILKGQTEETELIPIGKGLASHIGPVMQEMGISIHTGSFPSSGVVQPQIERLRRREPSEDDGDLNRAVRKVEQQLRTSPNGELVFGILEKHYAELVHLVHHRRQVMLIWNRSKGPAFANSFLRALRYPEQPIRKEIDGIGLHTFLNRMYDVLIKEGSDEFGNEVARIKGLVTRLAQYENMKQVIDHLKSKLITLPASGNLATRAQPTIFESDPHCLAIQSGSAIANSMGVPGTLGCFAHVEGSEARTILSSYHVLFGNGGREHEELSLIQSRNDNLIRIAIGETIVGKLGTVSFEGDDYYIDCAVGTITERWWTSNKYSTGSLPIRGFARARLGSRVKKLGSASGLTEGIIADVHYPDEAYIGHMVLDAPNQILIKPLESETTKGAFSLAGDSGAVLLDEANRVVGLLWGSNGKGEGVACHIGPVIQELRLKSVTERMVFLKKVQPKGESSIL